MSVTTTLSPAERETITLMADHGMNVTRVAAASYYSRQTVYDRLRNIKNKTGIDPTDFWGLHRLLTLLETEREEDENNH